MKKLALAIASLCIAATPVLACPHSDKAESSDAEAPRTAEKKKEEAPKTEKAKEAPKTAKPVEKAPEKKTDKVSAR